MEREALDWTMAFTDIKMSIKDDIEAHLLVEVDGNDMDSLFKDCERITEVMEQFECDEILFADSSLQKEQLWKMRRAVGEAVKSNSIYKEEDTVVPRAELPKLLHGVKEIGRQYGFSSVCYGHAGDGNLHINIIKGQMSDEAWNNDLSKGIRQIFELTVSLGGTISGEHGIGFVQKDYMDIAFSDENIALQKGIKSLFDPNGILNPKKVFV
jgi:glycolate oxidase